MQKRINKHMLKRNSGQHNRDMQNVIHSIQTKIIRFLLSTFNKEACQHFKI